MKTDKQFGEALKEIMEKGNITYERLAKLSGVSRTYLTQIIVHSKIPSKEIVEKIAKAVKIDPKFFKEYRIINIIEKIELNHWALTSNEINKIEEILKSLNKKISKNTSANIGRLKGKKEVEYSPSIILDITDLNENQKRTIKNLYNEFKRTNQEQKLEEEILESFISEFMNSEEYGGIIEAYRHYSDEDRFGIALQEYKEKYYKKNK